MVLKDRESIPGTVTIRRESADGRAPQDLVQYQRVIITGCQYQQQTNTQFQQTLLNLIHLLSFGDRISRINISGMGFSSSCKDGNSQSGVDDILDYYRFAKVSRQGDQVSVVIGRTPVTGYLVACTVQSVGAELMAYNFNFEIAALPRDQDPGTGSSGEQGYVSDFDITGIAGSPDSPFLTTSGD